MTPNSKNLKEVWPEVERIGRDFGVTEIRVFGSVARNTAGEGSDVDLLVRMEPGRSLLDLIGFEQEVAGLLGGKIDVVTEGGIHPALERTILREARSL